MQRNDDRNYNDNHDNDNDINDNENDNDYDNNNHNDSNNDNDNENKDNKVLMISDDPYGRNNFLSKVLLYIYMCVYLYI
jgi:hypothetical protein